MSLVHGVVYVTVLRTYKGLWWL